MPPRILDRIGLGLAALGRPGYINLGHGGDLPSTSPAEMEAHCHRVLDAAWSAGVRSFDAARSYGRAEEWLASWLRERGIAPGAVQVSSKWGYTYTAGWRVHAEKHEVKDHSLAHFERQWAESRALLGPWLTLYQVHSATLESGVLEDRAIHDALRELRASGVAIGLTLSGARQAETLERALALQLFDAVQATWNLLERSVEPALTLAKRAGLRVIVKEALANGRLTARNDDPRLAPLRDAARRLGTTPDALALASVLRQPFCDLVLSGAATVEQLHENLRTVEIRIDDDTAHALFSIIEDPDVYWSGRARLPWN
jgi:aryl-alcohol dehydrogenase-like predicted oxidoreductase